MDADAGLVTLTATARVSARTGVEMAAMTAAAIAARRATTWSRASTRVTIERIELLEKSGGRSGTWTPAGLLEQLDAPIATPFSSPLTMS